MGSSICRDIKMTKFLLLFVILGCNVLHAQENKGETFFSKVDSLNSYYDSDKAGRIVSIINNGKIIYTKGMGLANLEYNIPISDSTAFTLLLSQNNLRDFLR